MATAVVHVMAGVLLDPAGRVLLAQRPPGKHLAGMWEFPGGKLEPGESPIAGLARELLEELDIRVDPHCATPLVQVPWTYGERVLLLDAWCVGQWLGTPRSMEGQALQWQRPLDVSDGLLAPADREILRSLLAAVAGPASWHAHVATTHCSTAGRRELGSPGVTEKCPSSISLRAGEECDR